MAYEIPMYLAVGEYDFGQLPIKTASIIDGFNLWLEMNGCPTRLDLDECLATAASGTDPAVTMLGITADETYVETIDGSLHYFADFENEDGVTMLRFIGIAEPAPLDHSLLSADGLGVHEPLLQRRRRPTPHRGLMVEGAIC